MRGLGNDLTERGNATLPLRFSISTDALSRLCASMQLLEGRITKADLSIELGSNEHVIYDSSRKTFDDHAVCFDTM
jgi:hypothetical protein